MGQKRTRLLITFIFVLAFSLFFSYGKVSAATAIKEEPKLYYTVKKVSDGTILTQYTNVEGILKVVDDDGTHYVFCFDYMTSFPENDTNIVKTTNIVEALTQYGFCDLKFANDNCSNPKYLSTAESEALLKKIALYVDYLKQQKSQGNINDKQFIFYGQGFVWTLVSQVYNPNSSQVYYSYTIDTDDDHSLTHFGINNSASLAKQQELWNGATEYYNANKNKAGTLSGTIWYKEASSYTSATTSQSMFDVDFTIDYPEPTPDPDPDPEPEPEPDCVSVTYKIVGNVFPDPAKTDPTPDGEICLNKGTEYTQEKGLTTRQNSCKFNGWYTSSNLNGKWTDGTALDDDLILYGAWDCSTQVIVPATAASTPLIILGFGLTSIAIGAWVYLNKEKKLAANQK